MVVEAVISMILDQLKTIIIDKAREEVSLLVGVEKEVEKLARNLNLIRSVLADAEGRKTEEKLVDDWLDRLKEASYDMEDALDEWRTAAELEALHGQKKAASDCLLRKVLCDLLPCLSFRKLVNRHQIVQNIKEINQRLDDIAKEKDRYHLISKAVEPPKRPETSAFVDVSRIHGRDEVNSKILSHLFEGDGEPIQTISIVGFGGLGKTAVAQLVYNESTVQNHFERIIWVCVSDLFDEKKVAKAIIQGLENISGPPAHGLELEQSHVLLERISNSVRGKRFLLILDDVWAERGENWESLKVTFRNGAQGSRILVTTRDIQVAEILMESSQIIHLEKLGDEICWLILQERAALDGRSNKEDLEEVGKRIARRCKGLPLAAKTLGSLLRSKRTKREWQDVLNSEIWRFNLAQKDIFAPLLLSYYDLPPPIRRCFEYCVVYPKDHVIWARDLVDRWMAQAYLGSDNDADLESRGREYFEILASRSFFQDFEEREGGTMLTCKMHDIIHDFAQYLVNKEFMTKEVECDDLRIELGRSRHLTLMLVGGKPCPSISGAEKLRSLVIFSALRFENSSNSILEVLAGLLNQTRRLRLLDFRYADDYLGRQVPAEIGKLMHLRQLDLSYTGIENLPETLSNLLNLLNLDLMGCQNLVELPDWIEKLINLRFLRTSGCCALTHYPKHIRSLTSLRRLLGAIVRADCNDAEKFSIADLGHLQKLDTVWLMVKGDTICMDEARNAMLQNVNELRIWSPGKIEEDEIVEALGPPSDVNLQFFGNYWYLPVGPA